MNQRIEQIKTHFRENKKVYVTGGVCLTIGVVSGILLVRKNTGMQSSMTRIFSPGENNLLQIYLAPLGDPGNVVQCVETGTTYASQGELARSLGLNKSRISEHLAGDKEHLFGKHYEVLGKAGQALAK